MSAQPLFIKKIFLIFVGKEAHIVALYKKEVAIVS